MKRLVCVTAILLMPLPAFAQASSAQVGAPPATVPGQALTIGLGGYNYVEPGDHSISIHGAKFVGGYTGLFLLDERKHWFARANFGVHVGNTQYDGWCAPWQISPDSGSPNGYQLGIGDYSPCEDSGNPDWYLEGRALAGKDFLRQRWTWSPEAGFGVRHLSNGLDGVSGYRTDTYLYVPIGLTARISIGSHVLSFHVEYDQLIRGWQTTYQSKLGGGDVAATATTPAFTIDGFTDISFDQHHGWAWRAGATYELGRRWSVEPYWIRWSVGDSTVSYATATFTVNGLAADEQLGFYEPRNTTNELGVGFSFRVR